MNKKWEKRVIHVQTFSNQEKNYIIRHSDLTFAAYLQCFHVHRIPRLSHRKEQVMHTKVLFRARAQPSTPTVWASLFFSHQIASRKNGRTKERLRIANDRERVNERKTTTTSLRKFLIIQIFRFKKVKDQKLEKQGLGCAIYMKEYTIMMYLVNQIPWFNKKILIS